ncbi:MAG TPA: Rieske 2Fe-2S domain-containing protein [Chloroflexota bacterium]
MLTPEENELLTRVGPDTPMGEMMRRFWLPACLTEELSERDCDPIRVRLLGEDLVAFRDSDGRVGIMEEHCPHRGASLFFGRNEKGGLRCLYHGWKMAVDGRVLDTPCEPTTLSIRHRAFPVVEQGDVVWTYMGPPNQQPAFPDFPWTRLPAENRCVGKIDYACNYLQAIEGAIDSSHGALLHSGYEMLDWTDDEIKRADPSRSTARNTTWEADDTPYGFRYAAIRQHQTDPESRSVRISEFLVPFHCLLHPAPHMFVPADDETTWFYDIRTDTKPMDRAATQAERGERVGVDLQPDHRKVRTMAQNYDQDRQAMRGREEIWSYSGIRWGKPLQDMCVIESMGPVYDRTKEHLGIQDVGVVRMRSRMLAAVRHFMETGEVAELDPSIPFDRIRGNAYRVPSDASWREVTSFLSAPAKG